MASCSGGGDGGVGLGSSIGTTPELLKSQFSTREGVYRLLASLELSRSSRPPPIPYGTMSTQPPAGGPNPPLRLSFVTINSPNNHDSSSTNNINPEDEEDVEDGDIGMAESSNRALHSPGVIGHDLLSSSETEMDTLDKTTTRFCFNLGKELFVYPFQGSRNISDLMKPLDKRVYKGTFPTCHDFNPNLATPDSLSLLIGFSGGQIQLVEPISKEVNKLYNEDRMIDKTRVTCLRWIPKSTTQFLVAHASGQMYLYNIELTCGSTVPHYQNVKQGPGHVISNCKSKSPRNPINRWTLGEGAINEFAFSPCGLFLAVVSQDGFLRIFRYEKYELVGVTRSYFGGLICVCWSPDSKYVCVGGEDDLLTIWSFNERRVVARGQGHRSWVSVVAFDPYTTTYGDSDDCEEFLNSSGHQNHVSNDIGGRPMGVCSCDSTTNHVLVLGPDGTKESQCTSCSAQNCASIPSNNSKQSNSINHNNQHDSSISSSRNLLGSRLSRTSENAAALRLSVSENTRLPACYRLGSVSQDTQLCLWDLTEDILKQPFGKSRPTTTASGRVPGDVSPLAPQQVIKGTPSSQMNGKGSPPRVNSFPTSGGKGQIHLDRDVVDSVVSVKGSRSNEKGGASGSNTSSAENGNNGNSSTSTSGSGHGILSLRFPGLNFGQGDKDSRGGKEHRRNFSLGSKGEKANGPSKGSDSLSQFNLEDPLKLIGTQACPRLDECPLLEPLICKKISHERLTALIFREDAIVTACQDGVICTWARPGEDFRITNCNRKKYINTSLAQENIFNRFYNSKEENIEPL